jgi:flotillin
MARFFLETIIPILIFIIILTSISLKYYKKCPAGSMMVIFNNKSDAFGSTIKIIKSGGAFVWPLGGSYVIFDLSPFSISIYIEKLHDKDGILLHLKAKILLAISSYESEVQNAIERISGLNKAQINELSIDLVSSHLRSFFAVISIDETKDREKITASLIEAIKVPLEDIGLRIMNLDIIEIKKV